MHFIRLLVFIRQTYCFEVVCGDVEVMCGGVVVVVCGSSGVWW